MRPRRLQTALFALGSIATLSIRAAHGEGLDDGAIRAAIDDAGYQAA